MMYASKKAFDLVIEGNLFGFALLFWLLAGVLAMLSCATFDYTSHLSHTLTVSQILILASLGCFVIGTAIGSYASIKLLYDYIMEWRTKNQPTQVQTKEVSKRN